MIHVPGIYVDRIVQATEPKLIEVLATTKKEDLNVHSVQGTEHTDAHEHEISSKDWRHRIAARAAREIQDGFYVNLGVGIPTLVPEVSMRYTSRRDCRDSSCLVTMVALGFENQGLDGE